MLIVGVTGLDRVLASNTVSAYVGASRCYGTYQFSSLDQYLSHFRRDRSLSIGARSRRPSRSDFEDQYANIFRVRKVGHHRECRPVIQHISI